MITEDQMAMKAEDFSECDQFTDHRRQICRGERSDLSIDEINQYRVHWGLKKICAGVPAAPGQPPVIESGPSILIRGWNFAAAMTRWALAGMPRRTQEEINERLAICQACPSLQNDHCTKCGCACVEQNRLINKLALATEKCPDGKWD